MNIAHLSNRGRIKNVRPIQFGAVSFLPSSIEGLKIWVDFSDLTTLFQDSGCSTPVTVTTDPIGCAQDKSGTGNDFTQATTAKKSEWNEAGYALFDGADDALISASNLFPATAMTLFAKIFVIADADNKRILDLNDAANTYRNTIDSNSAERIQVTARPNSALTSANVFAGSVIVVTTTLVDGGNVTIWVDGVLEAGPTSRPIAWANDGGGSPAIGAAVNGLGTNFNGRIYQVLAYDSELSAANRASVEAYLA